MPALKTYDLFLSHVWRRAQNSEYYRLERLLRNANNFLWRNYSVPEHDPLGTQTDAQLRSALRRQIAPVNCFVVVSGMYVNYRRWIQEELDIALDYGKPIVGVAPWGQERTPLAVQRVAKQVVRWNSISIVAAVRKWSL